MIHEKISISLKYFMDYFSDTLYKNNDFCLRNNKIVSVSENMLHLYEI